MLATLQAPDRHRRAGRRRPSLQGGRGAQQRGGDAGCAEIELLHGLGLSAMPGQYEEVLVADVQQRCVRSGLRIDLDGDSSDRDEVGFEFRRASGHWA